MTPEGKVKALIRKRMEEEFLYCYRLMPVQNGMGAPGLDFFYCVEGLFVAIEAKAKGGRPTQRQSKTMRQIAEAGGMAFWVDDAVSLEYVIETIKRKLR